MVLSFLTRHPEEDKQIAFYWTVDSRTAGSENGPETRRSTPTFRKGAVGYLQLEQTQKMDSTPSLLTTVAIMPVRAALRKLPMTADGVRTWRRAAIAI